jgi:hypothetical protein
MSNIGMMIDPEVAQKMQAMAAADVKAEQPAFIVRKKATDPTPPQRHAEVCKCQSCKDGTTVAMTSEAYQAKYYPQDATKVMPGSKKRQRPRKLTAADGIIIDPESGMDIDANCVDCGTSVKIVAEIPQELRTRLTAEGLDPDEVPRVPMCDSCGTIRAQYAAIDQQRAVEIYKRDNTVTTINPEEQDMDISNVPDAEVGAAVKKSLKADKAEKVKAAKPKVEAERKKADKKAKKGRKANQAERKAAKRPGFRIDQSSEVPDLDFTEVNSLDESPSALERRPYNQARFRLLGEKSLDPETTTYRTLLAEHDRLAPVAAKVAKKRAKKTKKGGKKVVAQVAKVSAVDEAKVKKLAKATGLSKKDAREVLMSR